MSGTWEWPGSRWWRVDLHAHTPGSYDFGCQSDRDNSNWTGWITAARDAGIQGVAITDHNTAQGVGHLQATIAEAEDVPVLFPGVELTASDGSHLLLLLDPDRGSQHVEDLLSRAKVPVDQRGQPTSRSSLNVEQILDTFGNDALVIGAHINGCAGLLELTGEERITVLRHPGLAAVEIKPDIESDDSWLDGSRPEIGRQIPQVWSSDGHSFNGLGQRFTWVKMTKPNLEGLRLALLDGADSLKLATRDDPGDPNVHTSLALESITVNKGKYIGREKPTVFTFSPWLNAIIGGRGTGKSTLVDFCRKTLRRESELDGSEGGEEGSLRKFFDRRINVSRSRMDEGLLTEDTLIEIIYRKDGESFVLSWNPKGHAHPIARLDGTKRTPQVGNIRERFPVRIYSQKQLFALARDPNALLTVIDDSQVVRRVELDRSNNQMRNRYLSLCVQAREARNLARDSLALQVELEDIQHKFDALQRGGHAQALNEYRVRHQQNDAWQAILGGALQVVDQVGRSAAELSVADLDLGIGVEKDQAGTSLRRGHETLRRTVENLRRGVRKAVDQTLQDIEDIRSGTDMGQWSEALAASEIGFQIASARLAEQGIPDQNQYTSLLEKAALLERDIKYLDEEHARAAKLEKDKERVLADYRKQRDELSNRRQQFVRQTSSEAISVEVDKYANRENLSDHLSQILGIERFEDDRRAIALRIQGEQDQPWDAQGLDKVVKLMRQFLSGELDSLSTHDRRFETALRKVPPERIDRLALYLPEDAIRVRFKDEPAGQWRLLAQGSPGQQTAALLAFVLGYGTEPIILDQPEDDLDSTLIYELLVSRLRETKLYRQVIVVTHNPNIVVHGDAELVLSLTTVSGQSQIACQGGLQERTVRNEICRVMEGGQKAFESRYQRIIPPKAPGS